MTDQKPQYPPTEGEQKRLTRFLRRAVASYMGPDARYEGRRALEILERLYGWMEKKDYALYRLAADPCEEEGPDKCHSKTRRPCVPCQARAALGWWDELWHTDLRTFEGLARLELSRDV